MRMTETIRGAFVRAVMDDVPRVEYDEQTQKLIRDYVFKAAPAAIREAYARYPDYFQSSQVYVKTNTPLGGSSRHTTLVYVYLAPVDMREISDPALVAKVQVLIDKTRKQGADRTAMEEKLRQTILAFSTVATAKKALPELAKYLPDDEAAAIRTLPVVANVLKDLSSIGWPKGKKKSREEALA